jgi:hypothetical protein
MDTLMRANSVSNDTPNDDQVTPNRPHTEIVHYISYPFYRKGQVTTHNSLSHRKTQYPATPLSPPNHSHDPHPFLPLPVIH